MWRSNTGGFITAEHRSKKVVSKGIEWQDNKTLLISLFRRKTEFYFNKLNDRGHKNNACVNCRPKPTLALCEQESENRKRPSWALGPSCFHLPITSLYFQLTGTSEVFIFNGCHWDKTSKKKITRNLCVLLVHVASYMLLGLCFIFTKSYSFSTQSLSVLNCQRQRRTCNYH